MSQENSRTVVPIEQVIESRIKRFDQILPADISGDRFVHIAKLAISQTPDIRQCTPESVLECLMVCAQLGLFPGKGMDQAYLVKFGKSYPAKCSLIVGYKGFLDLMWNSGTIKGIQVNNIFSNEEFVVQNGTDRKVIHKPILDPKKRGEFIGSYGLVETKDNGWVFRMLSKEEIDEHRSYAKTQDFWNKHYLKMTLKTIIRELAKLCKVTPALAMAINADNNGLDGKTPQDFNEQAAPLEAPKSKEESIMDKMNQLPPAEEIGSEEILLTEWPDINQ